MIKSSVDLKQFMEETPSVEEHVEWKDIDQTVVDKLNESLVDLKEDRDRIDVEGKICSADVVALEEYLPEQYPLGSFTRQPTATNLEVGLACFKQRIAEVEAELEAVLS